MSSLAPRAGGAGPGIAHRALGRCSTGGSGLHTVRLLPCWEHLSPVPNRERAREIEDIAKEFVAAYRAAADRLRDGELTVAFPAGSFPPVRQFVPIPRARAPGTV